MREVMTVIYVADGERVIEPDTKVRENNLNKLMPGLRGGDLVESELNPLVYKRINN